MTPGGPDGTAQAPPLRSLLFVPGNRPDMVAKVGRSRPDAVALDLEDAVAPDGKDDARASVLSSLAAGRPGAGLVLVRVNPPGTPWHHADVDAVARGGGDGLLDGVVLPKYETIDQLATLRDTVPEGMSIVVGIESARGVADARPLLAAEPTAAYFGAEDFVADLMGRRTTEGSEILHARAVVRLAAHLAGVAAIDMAVVAVHDAETYRRQASSARDLGFHGKICLHPAQVALAHEAFTPSEADVEHARRVLEAAGRGVGVVDGQMVDAVHVTMARSILSRSATQQ